MTEFPTIVLVKWVDASVHSGWMNSVDVEKCVPNECRSIGYLLRQGPEMTVIAQSLTMQSGEVYEYGDIIAIPGDWKAHTTTLLNGDG